MRDRVLSLFHVLWIVEMLLEFPIARASHRRVPRVNIYVRVVHIALHAQHNGIRMPVLGVGDNDVCFCFLCVILLFDVLSGMPAATLTIS
jgi:hypothetical protein